MSSTEALRWRVRLWSGESTDAEQRDFEAWLAADPAHGAAWQRVQRLDHLLGAVPREVASAVLADRVSNRVADGFTKGSRSADAASPLPAAPGVAGRRRALRGIGLVAGGVTLAWAAAESDTAAGLLADHRTARGERLALPLPDGSHAVLNTGSALDIAFSASERGLRLRRGEMLVRTAPGDARPLRVETPVGRVLALGTRFAVRRFDEHETAHPVQVQVFDGSVQITPAQGSAVRLHSGEQLRFGARGAAPAEGLAPGADAWTRGLLVLEQQRLGEVLAELSRYRLGVLRCDPAVAALRVSGVYRLDDIDGALQALAQALPIRLQGSTRWWLTVLPA